MTTENILSTRSWEENHSTFKYLFKEEKLTRDGQNITRTTKTYVGPKRVHERLQWKKFGAALNTKEKTSSICGDVEFEFTYKSPTKKEEWVPNGLYISWAKEANWPDADIKKIIRSDRPDLVYMDLHRTKMGALFGPLIDSPAPKSTGKTGSKTEDKKPAIPNRKMGLKERMIRKQQERQTTETSVNPENSLSARLNRKKEYNKDNEHKCTLFIDNVPLEYHESDIKSKISEYDFKRVSIVKRDGVSIGKAFIELNNEDEAKDCLEFINGQNWEYSVINAQFSKPKPKSK